jgi:AcrR family transcriptional regulator
MVVVTDKKRDAIIEGAIKRFIHFGINKTTMNEIAEDLSVSKPSLYYYFPDKSSLILGVIDKIFADYFEQVDKEYKPEAGLDANLKTFIEIRHRFFQKYYMLHLSGTTPDPSLNSEILKTHFMNMKEKNLAYHAGIFQQAIENKEINFTDTEKIAELYLESMMGITTLCTVHGNKELFPSKKELKGVLEKQLNLSEIFVKGLK